jgi:L-gulono-1,4-lactone dehydrogenase
VSTAFVNWTGDQSCTPQAYFSPRSIDELSEAITTSVHNGWTVRAVGSGHSFSEAVLTDGALISLARMNEVKGIDEQGNVTVGAGITLHDLSLALDVHGRALENLGDIDAQSLAGATATGTHGTGVGFRNLSAGIVSLKLMTSSGEVLEISEGTDPDAWRAARVGLGALGIVFEMTMQTVPAFRLIARDGPMPLQEVIATMDDLADANAHFEFYMFPNSNIAQTRVNNPTDAPPQPRSKATAWLNDVLFENSIFGATRRVGRAFPSAIPAINRFSARAWGKSRRVDRSYEVFSAVRRVRFTEMEYAVPRECAAQAVTTVKAIADRKDLRINFPIEVRFVAADDALLSPAHGRDTCYIAVHAFEKMPWETYFRAVEEALGELGGRPHWGKRHHLDADTLRTRYPHFDDFLAVRNRLDPSRAFANAYIARVLGP